MPQRIHWLNPTPQPLWNAQRSKQIEQQALSLPQQPSLMERAGQATAQLACAIAPHAHQAWVLCGPGNNGGDGLVAARQLAQRGLTVWAHWLGTPDTCSADSLRAWQQLADSPVQWLTPEHIPTLQADDIVIDALLGLGQQARPASQDTPLQQLLQRSYASPAHTLAVDVPTGLATDSGAWLPGFAPPAHWRPHSRHTLSLLTIKPGLFTHHGRDACGQIWWDDLGCSNVLQQHPPTAWLNAAPARTQRRHNSHKGSFGDVLVIGGASSMAGAAILAATAALHHGAGRTLLHLLAPSHHTITPDLMQPDASSTRALLGSATVVCGCGGGSAIHAWLPEVLQQAPRLVLDADALNAIAQDAHLEAALQARRAQGQATILTPHPLEAARLLQQSTAEIQNHRLQATQTLAKRLQCTVVLKGSGSIIASPGQTPHINPTGNARLAIGGTGDVLAGLIAARWQQQPSAHLAACEAVWEHGAMAENWPSTQPLTASALACVPWQTI